MTDTNLFRAQRRTGPLDECERLALDRVRSVYPRPVLNVELLAAAPGASTAELNLGALRLQARGFLRSRRQLAVELTKRVDKEALADATAASAIRCARSTSATAASKPPALTMAEVVYVLGRTALHQPARTSDAMAAAPSPFEMLLLLAEAGGFRRVDELMRVIGRPDTARAYAVATEAASSIDPLAARALLKHHGLERLLGPLPKRTRRGQL